jgi:dynein heavy chain 2, cytosolic
MAERLGIAPRLFYALVGTYISIYKSKSSSKKAQGLHLQKGLEKLEEAKKLVDVLSKEAFEKQKLLEVKQTEASRALTEIEKSVG